LHFIDQTVLQLQGAESIAFFKSVKTIQNLPDQKRQRKQYLDFDSYIFRHRSCVSVFFVCVFDQFVYFQYYRDEHILGETKIQR